MKTLLFAVALVCILNSAFGFSNGFIEECCKTMTPPHGKQPGGVCPYHMDLERNDITAGETVAMKLSGPTFKGFMIQVHNENGEIAGKFQTDPKKDTAHLLTCSSIPGSAISHNSSIPKNEVIVYWISPAVPSTTYIIYITIAVTKDEVWIKQPVGKINIH